MRAMKYIDKKVSVLTIIILGMVLTFPLRDAFACSIGGVPFRLSEIWIILAMVLIISCSEWKINCKELSIVVILLLNLVITVFGVIINKDTIVFSYAFKYIVRNMLWIMVFLLFLGSRFEINSRYIDMLMRYTVWVQAVACFFTVVTNNFFYLGNLSSTLDRYDANFITIAGHAFHRLKGTCSEPGYMAALLPMLLYYFLVRYIEEQNTKKENVKYGIYILILFVISLFSFSSAVYGIEIIVVCYVLITSRPSVRKILLILFGVAVLLVALVVMLSSSSLFQALYDNVINKVSYYLNRKRDVTFSFSAADRSQHIEFAKEIISQNSFFELIFGRGTGGYYYESLLQTDFYQNNVSEAYNIYLSSLTDRGILGLAGVVAIFICCKKMVCKDVYSKALFCGIVAQGIHWILIGNFWLYYFWYEILFLIGYKRYIENMDKDANSSRALEDS